MNMGVETRIIEIVVALVVGWGAAWFMSRRAMTREFDLKLRRVTEAHRKQHEAVVDKLNGTLAMARKELEHSRQASPRHAAVAAADQRSAMARLEEQLKTAYAELDKLRLEVKGPAPVGQPKAYNGFADTQPFEARKAEPRKALQR
jgi:lipopolysaccharide export system protein LptC